MDIAHRRTDKILEELEKRIAKEYKQAGKEVRRKLNNYLSDIGERAKIQRQKMLAGEISKQEYRRWMTSHIAIGQRWQELRDNLAQDYANAGKIAKRCACPDLFRWFSVPPFETPNGEPAAQFFREICEKGDRI